MRWTTDTGGFADESNWSQYGSNSSLRSYGNGPVNQEYTITPPAGVYWFGLRVEDQAGNYSTESDWGYSPIRVTVSDAAPVSLSVEGVTVNASEQF